MTFNPQKIWDSTPTSERYGVLRFILAIIKDTPPRDLVGGAWSEWLAHEMTQGAPLLLSAEALGRVVCETLNAYYLETKNGGGVHQWDELRDWEREVMKRIGLTVAAKVETAFANWGNDIINRLIELKAQSDDAN